MATEYQISVAAAGDPVSGVNIIDERFMAETQRNIRGWDVGVLDNSFLSATSSSENVTRDNNNKFIFPLTYTDNNNIIVGRGIASAYGFDIKSEQDYSFSMTAPSSGTKYAYIYLQWNFSNPVLRQGTIGIWDNGASDTWTPQQDNLTTVPNGQYVMPLYRLAINTSGVISNATAWSSLGIKGNTTVGISINGSSVNAQVYKGVTWADMCRLCEESKVARCVIDNTTSNSTTAEFYVGDKLIRMEY